MVKHILRILAQYLQKCKHSNIKAIFHNSIAIIGQDIPNINKLAGYSFATSEESLLQINSCYLIVAVIIFRQYSVF